MVLLGSLAATLASPTGEQFLDTLMGEVKDEAFTVKNYEGVPDSLREYLEDREKEVVRFSPTRRFRRPRPRPRPRPSERTGGSRSGSESSSSKLVYENDIKTTLANLPPEVFQEYLARFMQEDPCPQPPDCYVPGEVDICGVDNRTIIMDENVVPYQWICRVEVEATGDDWSGSAFKVKISPDVGRRVLFSAAHVIRDRGGGYVPRVRIHCPGEAEVTVERNSDIDMWIAEEFLRHKHWDFDYAYITYPGNTNSGYGFQGFIDRHAIQAAGTQLHACGYPTLGDRQHTCISRCVLPVSPPAVRKLYCDDGNLVNVTDHKLPADIDIDFGESGGPLYDSTGNNYVAYGIVSLPADEGNCPGVESISV